MGVLALPYHERVGMKRTKRGGSELAAAIAGLATLAGALACPAHDAVCVLACNNGHAAGVRLAADVAACLDQNCKTECPWGKPNVDAG